MRLFSRSKRASRGKREQHSYIVDGTGSFHLYDDCPDIVGGTKHIFGAAFLKYRRCPTCMQKTGSIVAANKRDMVENEKKYMVEFLDNVRDSALPDDEKREQALQGLAAIRMQRFIWETLDALTEDN